MATAATSASPTIWIERKSTSKELSKKVQKAKNEKKIFVLIGGSTYIRNSLLNREWIEKIPEKQLAHAKPNTDRFSLALQLKTSPFHFIWQPRSRPLTTNFSSKPFVNSIIRERPLNFTIKDGIANCMNQFRWHYIEGVTDLNVQRTHVLSDRATKAEFFEDFRRTAITSFILYLDSLNDLTQLFYPNGTISGEIIDFSIQKVELLLQLADHVDIDTTAVFDTCAQFPKNQNKMLSEIATVVKGAGKFQMANDSTIAKYRADIRECAEKILNQWPHSRYDGYRNIWIFKPVASSSGNGIKVTNKEQEIHSIMKGASVTHVAQKYIERPLLIHNRKFDMRLYLLTVIKDDHIDVWLYRDCYVKFATDAFCLSNFNRSIHVTNYAVQKYFMNENDAVPNAKENMWTLAHLIEYFGSIGQPRLWEANIYPAIKQNVLAVVLPSFEATELTENNFELNGIDIMLTFDYQPIIIEINSVPALFFSKTVQEIITQKLLDDVIKVVVDHSQDASAYTGDFECIHTEMISKCEKNDNLVVTGKRITRTLSEAERKAIYANRWIPFNHLNEKKNINTADAFTNQYIYLRSL